jgi:hypothetical protein
MGVGVSKVAALYVDPKGVYANLPDIEVWDEAKDARLYAGPWPVVAHPPCERWGNFWYGGPLLHKQGKRKQLGADGGCFEAAINAVRTWGGVLEHPAASRAWKAFNIAAPYPDGTWRWTAGGFTCRVEQGHFGHRAPKATWLYCAGVTVFDLPKMPWAASHASGRVSGPHRHSRASVPVERMGQRERAATPPAFASLLLSIARTASPARSAA